MKIGKKVRIGAVDYKIEIVPDLKNSGGTGLFGQIAYRTNKISLESDLDEQTRVLTLWHEIFHGVFEFSGVVLPERVIEKLCDLCSSAIVQLLRDNPWLKGDEK